MSFIDFPESATVTRKTESRDQFGDIPATEDHEIHGFRIAARHATERNTTTSRRVEQSVEIVADRLLDLRQGDLVTFHRDGTRFRTLHTERHTFGMTGQTVFLAVLTGTLTE